MRTTLDIDDDILHAAKERAQRENKTAGQVLSQLARAALTTQPEQRRKSAVRFGFRPFPKQGAIITNELTDSLRDEDAY